MPQIQCNYEDGSQENHIVTDFKWLRSKLGYVYTIMILSNSVYLHLVSHGSCTKTTNIDYSCSCPSYLFVFTFTVFQAFVELSSLMS